eukprot:s3000_g4.t1
MSADGASKLAQNSGTAKAAALSFSPKDINQDRPVSLHATAVEGQPSQVSLQPNAADVSSGASPSAPARIEGFDNGQTGGKPPPFLLELFCGSAGVCAQFKTRGGRALGVDHHLKRSKLKCAAVQLDLTQPWVQELIEREIRLGRVDAVHMGPPCGTASRARNIPVKRKLRRCGAPNPRPLRSPRFPLGLPSLRGIHKIKVQAANCLYSFAAKLALLCEEHQVLFTIENPERSLMWLTPYFVPLVERFYMHVVDACMYGSEHKKSTGLLANFKAPRLMMKCSGNHQHAPWRIQQSETGEWSFDTAKEAEYPLKLASEIACSFLDELASRGHLNLQEHLLDHATKVAAEAQPRRTKGPLLLSEFKAKVCITCHESEDPPLLIPEDAQPPWQGVPIGSKRLDVQPVLAEEGVEGRLKVTYGVYFSPNEFIARTKELSHPFDIPLPLDEANMCSIAFILEQGPAKVAQYRADMLSYYIGRAKSLQKEELKLHDRLDEHVKPVLRSKRILLFKEMLSDAGISDTTLVDEMCDGFRLVGDLTPSGQFQPHLKPAMLSVEQLKQTATWSQKAVVASCKKVLEDREISEAVWQETIDQTLDDKKWVLGPFSAEEITQRLGPDWVPSRRFGVRQSGKVRAVDDFSQFLINAAVTSHEKIDLEGIDSICATARFFLGAASCGDNWEIPWDSGEWTGMLAKSWCDGAARDLFGRCLDLKHAYKQLVRNPLDSWSSVLAVANPHDSQVYFFESIALPFGSVSSVLAFNRMARALRTILARLFKLVVTNFFDDFCQLELEMLQGSAWRTAETALELLGWKISMGEDKRHPFSKQFEILGAVIRLPEKGGTVIQVANKESRIAQLTEQVDELRSWLGKQVPRSKIESLKGRLLYAAGHTYGRCTQLACQILHRLSGSGPSIHVSVELVHATAEALAVLVESKPRRIDAWSKCPPLLIYTDGAVEDGSAKVTHGGLVIDPWKNQSFFFGDHVPSKFVQLWQRSGKKQVIAQAEIFPILIAKDTWRSIIAGRSVLWFLDNESARSALVRCYSPVLDNFFLLQLNARLDSEIQSRHWYNRVPSRSNPSDDASRLEFSCYDYATQVKPSYEAAMHSLQKFREGEVGKLPEISSVKD